MVRKKKERIYTVGVCKFCNELFDTSVPFVVFANKTKAHHECYRIDAEIEQKRKGVI
mgnify:CR=1 FL=1